MASRGRRRSRPHLPPEHVLHHEEGESADGPAEGEHCAEQPGAQNVVPAEPVLGLAEESKAGGNHREDQRNNDCSRLPDVDKGRCAQIRGEGFGVMLIVSHFLFPY